MTTPTIPKSSILMLTQLGSSTCSQNPNSHPQLALTPNPFPSTTCLLAQWWNLDQGSQELVDFQDATYSGSYADYNIWTTLMQGDVLGCDKSLENLA